jgi:putative transposase
MPWRELSPMDERRCFIRDYQTGLWTVAELCRRYGVSRKTGHKWIGRFEAEGWAGLEDRSRRPLSCSHAVPEPVAEALIRTRKRHPTWGARKLLKVVRRRHPDWHLPSASTAHEVIKRAGLVPKRRKRTKRPHPGRPMTPMDRPNAVWTGDFKGQFKTLDGIYVFPLTIQDGCSRYLIEIQGLDGTKTSPTKAVFRRAFQTYGLPERIRTDNGVPFAANSLARLSRLGVWFIRLGITPELIEPGRPQQNGRHERMHLTLKRETARPPKRTRRAQQRRFGSFRVEFNTERPHEAIGMRTPSELYEPSPRPYPRRLPDPEYPAHYEVRKVSDNGGIRWANRWVNVTSVLGGEFIGLEEVDDGIWHVFFGAHLLGYLIDELGKIEDRAGFLSRTNQRLQNL